MYFLPHKHAIILIGVHFYQRQHVILVCCLNAIHLLVSLQYVLYLPYMKPTAGYKVLLGVGCHR